jgi:putative dimethyl sulfoxide reductase chaperone
MAETAKTETKEDILSQWRAAVHSDLLLLARLHDREADASVLEMLKQDAFPTQLGLNLGENDESVAFMHKAIIDLPVPMNQSFLDELAADYAAIYLNHTLQASPCESVWLDEEGLMRQQPMFQVRTWYEKYGLHAENWRLRPDDHLVCQLQFIAHLITQDTPSLEHIAQFMDEHILLWIKDFAAKVSHRAATAYYVGLAILTATYLTRLREIVQHVQND